MVSIFWPTCKFLCLESINPKKELNSYPLVSQTLAILVFSFSCFHPQSFQHSHITQQPSNPLFLHTFGFMTCSDTMLLGPYHPSSLLHHHLGALLLVELQTEFEVDKILESQMVCQQCHYLVSWKDYHLSKATQETTFATHYKLFKICCIIIHTSPFHL